MLESPRCLNKHSEMNEQAGAVLQSTPMCFQPPSKPIILGSSVTIHISKSIQGIKKRSCTMTGIHQGKFVTCRWPCPLPSSPRWKSTVIETRPPCFDHGALESIVPCPYIVSLFSLPKLRRRRLFNQSFFRCRATTPSIGAAAPR